MLIAWAPRILLRLQFQHMPCYAHDSVFPSRSRSPVGRSKQVLRTYFPNSYSSPSRRSHGSPRVARGGALVWQTSDGLSPYTRDGGGLLARRILLGTSFDPRFLAATVSAEERRECCALPRIIVYQHAVCATNLITWWMLTYSLMPILHTTHRPRPPCCYPSFIITPCHPFAMMYGNTGSLLLLAGDGKNVVTLFMTRSHQEYICGSNIEMQFDRNKNWIALWIPLITFSCYWTLI